MTAPRFNGFPQETLAFLRGLTENNNREQQPHLVQRPPCRLRGLLSRSRNSLRRGVRPRLVSEVSPETRYQARVGGSLFRINRDVRFSRDKSPYKSHIDLWFWQGDRRGWESPGFFMRLLPDALILGAGIHHFSREQLSAYREAVVDPQSGAALQTVANSVNDAGFVLGEATRKTVPRGFDPAHERAGFLLYDGLAAHLEEPVPAELHTPRFVDYSLDRFKPLKPVNDWLRDHLQVESSHLD